ncbi:hypothetical protein CYLTODRAFT_156818 [Cylindrobasidium torrendii FP15055 ss-10]|uniref:RNI-like protein n=1 Tax=Cylindrobasidium torrendii FP15055 ss-10 TaxID=1314674 RepID=A0A0D7BLF6_9AGAR|nr:hypothetical protein CYLTODRAFT_156818 [Cylindrobasidium torrendii FP15055 ss-10]
MRPSPLSLDIATNQTKATDALIHKYSAYIRFLRYRIYVEETGLPDDLEARFESLKELEVIVDTDRETDSDSDSEADPSTVPSDIRYTQIDINLDEYLSPFRRCTSLEVLDLSIDTHSEKYSRQYFSCANIDPESMELLWNNLRVFRLHIKDKSFFPLANILAACQMLEDLEVVGYKGVAETDPDPASVELPRLSTFRLENVPYDTSLPTFNVPSLQTLSLEDFRISSGVLSSLFCVSHQLSTLRLQPCNDTRMLREWRDMVANTGRPLDCLDLHVSSELRQEYYQSSSDASDPVFPLAREVRLEFPKHMDRFVALMRWVQEDNHYLESLTLVFNLERYIWDAEILWQRENRGCDSPAKEEMLEWAEDRLRRSDFMVRVNSIARSGVTVKMIMKGDNGSETRVEDVYLDVQVSK